MKKNLPGTEGVSFFIKFDNIYFAKGDILTINKERQVQVLKVYKRTLWRRLLTWLGFRTRLFQCKVIHKINDNKTATP